MGKKPLYSDTDLRLSELARIADAAERIATALEQINMSKEAKVQNAKKKFVPPCKRQYNTID